MDFVRKYWTAVAFICGGLCLGLRFTFYRRIGISLFDEGRGAGLCLLAMLCLSFPVIEEVRRSEWYKPAPSSAKLLSYYTLGTYSLYFLFLLVSFFPLPYHDCSMIVRAFCAGLALHSICGVFTAKIFDALFSDGYWESLKEIGAIAGIAALCGLAQGAGGGIALLLARLVKFTFTGA